MTPEILLLKLLTSQNPAVFFKIGLTPATGFAILSTCLSLTASFLKENASESNLNPSLGVAGKSINISLPAILWSFDTISLLTFFL